MRIPQVKICGLTRTKEAEFLNQAKADYAGFVFFEKSKRNITFVQAEKIRKLLSRDIKQVAVTVNPDRKLCQKIEEAGFDILQVHGKLKKEVLENTKIPIWRACNIEQIGELEHLEHHKNIDAYVVDAKTAGGGKTFDWNACQAVAKKKSYYFHGKKFVLAGGLNQENVRDGIRIFAPDVVDVSSGVEITVENCDVKAALEESFRDKCFGMSSNKEIDFAKTNEQEKKIVIRKDRKLIVEFVRKVRECEKNG